MKNDEEFDKDTIKLMDLFGRFSASMEEHSIENEGVSVEVFVSAVSVMVDSFEHQAGVHSIRESLIHTLKNGPRMLFEESENGEFVTSGVMKSVQ